MHRTLPLLALAACVGLGPHASAGTAPAPCTEGAFEVAGPPLLPAPGFEPPDRVILGAGSVAIASGCPPVAAELRSGRRGTWLRAHWDDCAGLAEGVRLRARIQPGCHALVGRLRTEAPPARRRFAAVREAAGACDVAHPCAEGQLCELPAGVCASALDAGTCVDVPSACPDVVAPVCGCDGRSYGNDCERRAARVQKAHDGACPECRGACDCYERFPLEDTCPLLCPGCGSFWACEEGQCVERCGPIPLPLCERFCDSNADCAAGDFCRKRDGACGDTGTCTPRPEACPFVYEPVCGCDGRTYGNRCEAAAAGVSVARTGACGGERCGTIVGLPCDEGEFCDFPPGSCQGADLEGTCVPVPDACITLYDPVCGCDGRTYGNDCERLRARVGLDHEGRCKDATPCGPSLRCDREREICVAKEPIGPAIVYACKPVPAGCADDRGCGCAGKSLCEAPFDTCRELGENALSCECIECQ
jgi:hypothetical protein